MCASFYSAFSRAIEQYDFSGYSTFNNSNIDPKSFTPIILGIVVLLGGLFYFLFGFLKKNASKVGVELNPTRTRTDFTSQYRMCSAGASASAISR